MDYKALKEKFFMGTTSLEEEDALRRYLRGDDLSAEANADKEMMLAMLQPVEYDCSAAMEEVSALIDRFDAQETVTAGSKRPTNRVVRYLYPAAAVAAALALLFVVVPYSRNNVQSDASDVVAVTDNGEDVIAVTVTGQSAQGGDIITVELNEPECVQVSEPVKAKTAEKQIVAETDVMLAQYKENNATSPVDVPDAVVLRGVNAGLNDSVKTNVTVGDDASFTLSESPLIAITDENDTFSNPQDAAAHLDVLLEIFSQAASGGVEEQKMHLKKFVVMNSTAE